MTSKNQSEWLRARQPEQIEERRQSILQAASALLEEHGLDGTGINAIARQAEISKANIYRYFESREAILLQLLLEEHQLWLKSLQRRLKNLKGSKKEEQIAQAATASLVSRPRYCILLGSLANVLEQNVGPDTVRAFKREMASLSEPALASLQQAHPGLTLEKGHQFLALLAMTASGIWPHCHPADAVQEVLAEKEFMLFRFRFQGSLLIAARGLVREILRD
ncbi:MAG: TetR family transcriptional regulator [Planctomycetota bacterium]